ncbi:hypothetical protein BS47DRAFT_1392174 [Hydnum rufescens UP504]|uniref:AMP-dependent synthetase/ligase domain-containing protein n=1 Tax=Hydnum rufescens UP504 TaxID=1448309 RepID=A0A9P6AZ83_9AGAM|nr:hypothetical protein BS47DRAFT_1392174 [Hydnum rufescens UP504]
MPHQIIYNSLLPPVEIKSSAIFTYAFSDKTSRDHSPAFIDAASGTRISRLETYELSLQLAYALKQRGRARGEVAMIFSPNSLAWPLTFFGLLAAGLRVTMANSSYTPPELIRQLNETAAGIIFVHPTLFPVLLKAFKLLGISDRDARRRVVIMSYVDQDRADEKAAEIGPEWTQLRELFGKGRLHSEELFVGDQVHETALLCYSSDSIGMTGLSKGVEITHNNIISLITALLTCFFIPLVLVHHDTDFIGPVGEHLGFSLASQIKLNETMTRLVIVLLWDFVTRVPLVIMPRFEPNLFAQTIEKYKVSRACVVPPILVVMSFHPAFENYDMSTLRLMLSGAAPLRDSLVNKVLTRLADLGNTQIRLSQGYGLTETLPAAHFLPLEDAVRKSGTIGKLLPNLQARLVDDSGNDIDPGPENRGELWLRGPNIMKQYLNNPEGTKNSITPDGWFKTGDIATVDDEGFFSIVDRKIELIKYKGFQVPPADLEAVLLSNEDILDAGVIGVESVKDATELPRYVALPLSLGFGGTRATQRSKGGGCFGKEMQEWIKTKVADHKLLRGGVIIIDTVPKRRTPTFSASGKILRAHIERVGKEGSFLGEHRAHPG